MINVVLFQPEIPPNTGNVIRLTANTGARLHLIEPLGFALDDRRLRRAGLDYHEYSDLLIHKDWSAFLGAAGNNRIFGFSTKAERLYSNAEFASGDYLLFGPETRGLPADIRMQLPAGQMLRIPMLPASRSLNLSNAVALVVYEAWRQLGFPAGA